MVAGKEGELLPHVLFSWTYLWRNVSAQLAGYIWPTAQIITEQNRV